MSGACKAWNDQGFFYWIYGLSEAAAEAKWQHNRNQKVSINKIVQGFFNILIGCLDIDM